MGVFTVSVEVCDPGGTRFEQVDALVDTGASYTVLPASMLHRLDVKVQESVECELADGRTTTLGLGQTLVRIDGRQILTFVLFGDEGAGPLLGAYTLEGLRLAVDSTQHRLVSAKLRM